MADQNPNVPAGVDPKAVTPITPPELLKPRESPVPVKERTDLPPVTGSEAERYEQIRVEREGVIKGTLDKASQASPDTEASIADIAKRRGVPVDYVRRNVEHFKKLDWAEKAPARKVAEQTPELARWLTEKNNAAISHDDLENMGALEWFFGATGRAAAQGVEQMNVARLRAKQMFAKATGGSDITQEEKDQLNASAYYMQYGGELGAESWFGKAVVGSARLVPNIAGALVASAPAGFAGAKVGGLVGPQGAAAGAVIGAGTAAFAFGATLEGGLAYHELLGEVDDEGKPYDEDVAFAGALIIGGINGGLEVVQLERLARLIPGLDQLTTKGSRDAVKLALKNPTIRAALAKAVKTYGGTVLVESGTEGVQRLTNIVVDELGKAVQSIDGAKFETGPNRKRTKEEMATEVIDESIGALTSMALLPVPGVFVQTRANLQKVREGKATKEFFVALGESVTAAKTVERAPAQAAEFISRLVKDGPVENVYLPTDTFSQYWQSKNIDPREMAAELTGNAAAFDEALRDKVDIIIPTERYATKLAATEHHQFFQDELRLQPGQYNGRESKEFEGEVEAKLKELQEATALATDALKTDPAVQEHGQVYDQLRAELEPIVGPKLADGYAKLHEAFFGTMGTKAGIGARQLFDRYALKVGREGITPGVAERVKGSSFTQPDYQSLRTQALAGGFTYAPLDETQPKAGFAVSAFPGRELAVNTDDLTELTIASFIAKNQDALSQKGAHIGAWLNEADGKIYLDVSMVAETPAQADAIAREHQQLAYYDLGKGEQVNVQSKEDLARFTSDAAPTQSGQHAGTSGGIRGAVEGPGTQQFEKREAPVVIGGLDAAPAERVDGALLLSTRYIKPASKNREVAGQLLDTRAALYENNPAKLKQAATLFRGYKLLTKAELKKAKTDEQVIRASIDAMKRNLKTLYEKYPEKNRERAKLWYVGANRIAHDLAEKYGVSVDQAAGVLAALSPTKDWFQNVSLAERVLQFTQEFEKTNPVFTEEMFSDIDEKSRAAAQVRIRQFKLNPEQAKKLLKKKDADLKEVLALVGKSWSEMKPDDKAKLLRAHDEKVNAQTYAVVSPEGDLPGLALNADGSTPSKLGWQSYANIGAAISITLDGSTANIHEHVGAKHKVRSFYNNISNPFDPRSVTIDTHAVAAAFLQPLTSKSSEVKHTMGSKNPGEPSVPKDATTGADGTNPIIAEAYFELAEELGILPRELQSVTWEAIRSLMTADQKGATGAAVTKFNEVLESYGKGSISHAERFDAVSAAFNGFDVPAWEQYPVSEQGALAAASVSPRRPTVAAATGVGAASAGRPAWGDTNEPNGLIRGPVAGGPAAGLTQLYQDVWHGSGALFEKFDLSYLGSGEGNQAYGWGLYFASRREIAEWYRDQNQQESRVLVAGNVPQIDAMSVVEQDALRHLELTGDVQLAKEALVNWEPDTGDAGLAERGREFTAQVLAALEKFEAQGVTFKVLPGRLYEVSIPDEDTYLDWDLPLSEQSPLVQEAMAKLGYKASPLAKAPSMEKMQQRVDALREQLAKPEKPSWTTFNSASDAKYILDNMERLLVAEDRETAKRYWATHQRLFVGSLADPFGVSIYRELVAQWKQEVPTATQSEAQKAASLKLATVGLSGIRYKDAGARGTQEASYNYVVVDDNLVQIQRYEQGKRGVITIGERSARSMNIDLLKKADPTTFFHESAHMFFEVMGDIRDGIIAQGGPTTPEQGKILQDYNTLLAFSGVTDRKDVGRDQHEKIAEAFEDWLMKGNAPSAELRSLFGRMRAWFMGVYKAIRQSSGELTPEVEDVFARMLATDQAIEQERAAADITPLFSNAERAGIPNEEFESYRALVEDTHSKATEGLQAQVFQDLMKRRQDSYQQRRAEVRPTVEAQVREEPVYRALDAMRALNNPIKLSTGGLVEAYGTDVVAKFPADLHAPDGINLQAASELLGFNGPDALVKGIANAQPFDAVVDERTDALLQEEFGDKLTATADLHAAAQEQVNGPLREKIVQAELAALTKGMVRSGIPPVALIKAAVERRIGITKVRNLKPGLFLQAAQRHSKKAFDLLAAGDRSGAVQAKRDELIALTFFRQARDMQKKVEATRKRLGAYGSRPTIRQRIGLAGADYLQQIDGLLERYEFAKVPKALLDKRVSLLKWAEGKKAAGQAVQLSADVLSEARQVNWQELTTDELIGVAEAVEHIAHLARVKNRLAKNAKKRSVDEAAGLVADSMEKNRRKGFKVPDEPRLPGKAGWRTLQGWFTEHLKISTLAREMDGDEDAGPVTETLIRPLNEAATAEAVMNEQATIQLFDIFKLFGSDTRSLYQVTTAPGVAKPMSRMARLMVGLNAGNADNRQRIDDEYGPQQVQAILSSLDGTDWAFIQRVWDQLDSYWPQIADKQERVTGVRPEKVIATEVDTRFGKMRGGYFPLKYEPLKDIKAAQHSKIEETSLDAHAAYVQATTRRGHTEARLAEMHGRKLRRDFGVITEHLSQVIHDLTHHEALMDVQKILGHGDVTKAFEEHYGTLVYEQFTSALTDIAKGDTGTRKHWEKVLGHLRTGSTVAAMGLSFTTTLMQPFGLLNGATRVGYGNMGRAIMSFIGPPSHMSKMATEVYAKSEFMRMRGKTFQREVNEIRNQIGMNDGQVASWMRDIMLKTTLGKVDQHAVAESYFWMIQKAQQMADMPTWLAAYQKAATTMEEADAIAVADQAVLDTQGGGQVKDLASIQRGSQAFKLFTNFFSYFSTVGNSLALRTRTTKWNDPYSVGRLACDYAVLVGIPASLNTMVIELLRGDEGDDDEALLARLAREQLSYLFNMVIGLREVSSALQGFDYTGPAGARGFSVISQAMGQAKQVYDAFAEGDDVEKTFDRTLAKSVLDSAGILFHFPSTQVFRTAEGIMALWNDETDRPTALLFGPPREKK